MLLLMKVLLGRYVRGLGFGGGIEGPQQIGREAKGCAGREGDCRRLLAILPDVKDRAGADGD
ncbi:hypothetical protein DIE28_12590 [Paracoccus thiocyanatus]|uniref:Uncharacterized protein n=1 Tax=Paracoccus thiocyanatus TaxID=34006 RepID=A0A3D8P999_9RHOB|nr:hypothetical protein DIE28_12590 [Paracoccus thiocyanatus]